MFDPSAREDEMMVGSSTTQSSRAFQCQPSRNTASSRQPELYQSTSQFTIQPSLDKFHCRPKPSGDDLEQLFPTAHHSITVQASKLSLRANLHQSKLPHACKAQSYQATKLNSSNASRASCPVLRLRLDRGLMQAKRYWVRAISVPKVAF